MYYSSQTNQNNYTILQPFFYKPSSPTDLRVAFKSSTIGGAPLNMQAKGKTLRELFYYPRDGHFIYKTYDDRDNCALGCTNINAPSQTAIKGYGRIVGYNANMTRVSYSGGLSYVKNLSYETKKDSPTLLYYTVPYAINFRASATLSVVVVMTAAWTTGQFGSNYPCIYFYHTQGGTALMSSWKCKKIADYGSESIGYISFETSVSVEDGDLIMLYQCYGSGTSVTEGAGAYIMDMMVGLST